VSYTFLLVVKGTKPQWEKIFIWLDQMNDSHPQETPGPWILRENKIGGLFFIFTSISFVILTAFLIAQYVIDLDVTSVLIPTSLGQKQITDFDIYVQPIGYTGFCSCDGKIVSVTPSGVPAGRIDCSVADNGGCLVHASWKAVKLESTAQVIFNFAGTDANPIAIAAFNWSMTAPSFKTSVFNSVSQIFVSADGGTFRGSAASTVTVSATWINITNSVNSTSSAGFALQYDTTIRGSSVNDTRTFYAQENVGQLLFIINPGEFQFLITISRNSGVLALVAGILAYWGGLRSIFATIMGTIEDRLDKKLKKLDNNDVELQANKEDPLKDSPFSEKDPNKKEE